LIEDFLVDGDLSSINITTGTSAEVPVFQHRGKYKYLSKLGLAQMAQKEGGAEICVCSIGSGGENADVAAITYHACYATIAKDRGGFTYGHTAGNGTETAVKAKCSCNDCAVSCSQANTNHVLGVSWGIGGAIPASCKVEYVSVWCNGKPLFEISRLYRGLSCVRW
jgi:hypothetical protein